jgi:hypothetical protein
MVGASKIGITSISHPNPDGAAPDRAIALEYHQHSTQEQSTCCHLNCNNAYQTSLELPDSDGMPVDNKDQNFLPNLLLFLLEYLWEDRND